jgi:hypothetical protein
VVKNGYEMQGVVINKFIHLCGGNEFGIERDKHWILLLEGLIMIKEFLKQISFRKKDVKTFQEWQKHFLAYYSNVVN